MRDPRIRGGGGSDILGHRTDQENEQEQSHDIDSYENPGGGGAEIDVELAT